MTTYASFLLHSALSGQAVVGQTPDVGTGTIYLDQHSNAAGATDQLIDPNGYVYPASDPTDSYAAGLPHAGSFSASQLQCTFDLNILSLLGRGGIRFGTTQAPTTSNFGFSVEYDANNLRWSISIPGFAVDYATAAQTLATGVHTGYRATYVIGPGSLTTITLYDNLGNQIITANFANSFTIMDGGFFFTHAGTTAMTATTGVHVGNLVVSDISIVPTATLMALTGFSWNGTQTPGTAWEGNVSGTAAHGSKTPILVELSPINSFSGSNIIFTPSDGGAGGTFSAATYTLTAGQTNLVMYYTPPSSGASVNISVANNASLTAVTNQPVTLTANLAVVLSNSFGASFGLPNVAQGYPNQVADNLLDYTVMNFSISGMTTTQIIAAQAAQIAPATGLPSSGKNQCIFWEITNDINNNSQTPAQAIANVQTLYSAVKSEGYTFICGAMLNRTGNAITSGQVAALNASLLTLKGSAWDVFVPFQNDQRIGSASYPTSIWQQGDGLHPNFAGESIAATYFSEAVEPGAAATPTNLTSGGGSGKGSSSGIGSGLFSTLFTMPAF